MPANSLVGVGLVATRVHPIRTPELHKGCGRPNVLLDSGQLDDLAIQAVASMAMESIHGKPDLALAITELLHEQVFSPLHIVGKHEIVDPAGANRPKVFGISGIRIDRGVKSAE